MALLEVVQGTAPGKRYSLGRESVLGRHPDCQIVLDVAAVSRHHARVVRDGHRYLLEDLQSRNGSFVNGQRVEGRQQLRQGDRVQICDQQFIFYENAPSEMLAGPLPSEAGSSSALLLDDRDEKANPSTIMSSLDVSSSGSYLDARPEAKLRAMVEIAQALGRAVGLDEVLAKLLDGLFKIFVQADRGFVILRDGTDGRLVPRTVKHRRESDDQVQISRTIVEQAMESKQALLSADAASDERFNMAQSVADLHIRSLMCAPLIDSEGNAVGTLQIDTLDQRSRFTADDLEVLASVATQAAVAIENAELHEQAVRQKGLERDLAVAHTVQLGLLPDGAPLVPGYHFFSFYDAASEVGGDYYDYVPLPGGRIAVVVADVSGKGVAAALLMAKLSGEVRLSLATDADPAIAVRKINAHFNRSGWEGRFVTFVAAILDPATHEVTVVNAGHMPPLLRHSGGEVEELGAEATGLPLGVLEDYAYEATTRALEPGDVLTMFTDGFSEAMNAEGEMYGLERLRSQSGAEAVSVDDLGALVVDDVRDFVGGHPQSDDMCLACFGRDEG